MENQTEKVSVIGKVISQLIAFVFFLVLPGVLTAITPVSWIKFQRQGDRVTARADVCLFFLIPYRTLTVDPVSGLGDRTKSGSLTRSRRTGSASYTQAETQGFLAIEGPNGTAEVSVSPHDLASVTMKCEAFLKDPQATELKLFVVANWKFGVIAGGPATLFSVVYVFGVVCATAMFLLRSAGLVRKSA